MFENAVNEATDAIERVYDESDGCRVTDVITALETLKTQIEEYIYDLT